MGLFFIALEIRIVRDLVSPVALCREHPTVIVATEMANMFSEHPSRGSPTSMENPGIKGFLKDSWDLWGKALKLSSLRILGPWFWASSQREWVRGPAPRWTRAVMICRAAAPSQYYQPLLSPTRSSHAESQPTAVRPPGASREGGNPNFKMESLDLEMLSGTINQDMSTPYKANQPLDTTMKSQLWPLV